MPLRERNEVVVKISGVMIPGLESVPEPDFELFSENCDSDSNSSSKSIWNRFQIGIGSKAGIDSSAGIGSRAGIGSNQRMGSLKKQKK